MAIPVISSRSNPFEIFLLVACLTSGISGVIDPSRGSQAVANALPLWELYVWYSGLALGSLITLIGAIGSRLVYLYLERMGLTLLTGLTLGYTLALVSQVARPVTLPIAVTAFFCIACFARLRQINVELKADRSR